MKSLWNSFLLLAKGKTGLTPVFFPWLTTLLGITSVAVLVAVAQVVSKQQFEDIPVDD